MKTHDRFERLMRADKPWLADGGLETDLIFSGGFDLPLFASFHLLESQEGRDALVAYFERYVALARSAGTGFVLDTATWRSGVVWGRALGRDAAEMAFLNHAAVDLARTLRDAHETDSLPILINGAVGPAGDGYQPEALLTPDAAKAAHLPQIEALAEAGADMISAITMTHTGEALGIVAAAQEVGLPVVVSFTVETDGLLPTGETLADAIAIVDAATSNAPVYYMVNCAHPDHFSGRLNGADWLSRIGGIRANASRMSHAELDEAEELDEGNPEEFGTLYGQIGRLLPNLRVIGGCCGTDHRHVGCASHHLVAA